MGLSFATLKGADGFRKGAPVDAFKPGDQIELVGGREEWVRIDGDNVEGQTLANDNLFQE